MFRDLINNLVSNVAFPAVGDLVETVTYEHSGRSTYDTKSGKVSPPVGAAREFPRAIFAKSGGKPRSAPKDVSSKKVVGLQKVLIPSADLQTGPPATNDVIIRADHDRFSVRDFDTDPASAMWVLEVERIGGANS